MKNPGKNFDLGRSTSFVTFLSSMALITQKT
jgi:hypothetical protein